MTFPEADLAELLRSANLGDSAAYERFLRSVTPYLRMMARRALSRMAAPSELDHEDVVQETLLALHLKRQTWDANAAVGPWLRAIVQYKLIDILRRRRIKSSVSVDDIAEKLAAEEPEQAGPELAEILERNLLFLSPRSRDALHAIGVEGLSVREAARRLSVSEGSLRVALHRGIKTIAERIRQEA